MLLVACLLALLSPTNYITALCLLLPPPTTNYNLLQPIMAAIEKLSKTHAEHISQYGTGNEQRLTGKHETCDINTFRWVPRQKTLLCQLVCFRCHQPKRQQHLYTSLHRWSVAVLVVDRVAHSRLSWPTPPDRTFRVRCCSCSCLFFMFTGLVLLTAAPPSASPCPCSSRATATWRTGAQLPSESGVGGGVGGISWWLGVVVGCVCCGLMGVRRWMGTERNCCCEITVYSLIFLPI